MPHSPAPLSFDQVYFVDLNANGNVFCYGQTAGHMPITSGVYRNVNSGQFLQKFSPDLSTLEFSTVFGSGSTKRAGNTEYFSNGLFSERLR